MPAKKQPPKIVRDVRGNQLSVGDFVVAERSYYGMKAGVVVEVRTHIKVQIAPWGDQQAADWFDPDHVIKVFGFPDAQNQGRKYIFNMSDADDRE